MHINQLKLYIAIGTELIRAVLQQLSEKGKKAFSLTHSRPWGHHRIWSSVFLHNCRLSHIKGKSSSQRALTIAPHCL